VTQKNFYGSALPFFLRIFLRLLLAIVLTILGHESQRGLVTKTGRREGQFMEYDKEGFVEVVLA
jgi:hypothetical protein